MSDQTKGDFVRAREAQFELMLAAAGGLLTPREAEEALAEKGLEAILGATREYARRRTRSSYWPVGVCISWLLTRDLDEAVRRYARHQHWGEARADDDWGGARERLIEALKAGQLEAAGLPAEGGERLSIPALDWFDLRIVRRGPYDEIRDRDGEIAFRDVQILAERVRELWPARTQARRAALSRQELEAQFLEALKARMRANPDVPMPKARLWREFEEKGPEFRNVSKRARDRLFTQAARETGANAWSAPGARPRQAKNG